MIIEVVASSSSGNCYIVRGARDVLLIEAGIPVSGIKKALKYDLSGVAGCLVSHCHMDHAKAVKDILALNIETHASCGTFEALGLSNHPGIKAIQPNDSSIMLRIGEFKVRPFAVEHDAPESLGFMIRSEILKQTIVFATDTYYLRHRFQNVHCYMVEANYSRDILIENVEAGRLHPKLAERTTLSHFEIDDTIEFLRATDTNRTKKVILLHPSAGNADPVEFERRVKSEVGIDAVTAAPGLVVEL